MAKVLVHDVLTGQVATFSWCSTRFVAALLGDSFHLRFDVQGALQESHTHRRPSRAKVH